MIILLYTLFELNAGKNEMTAGDPFLEEMKI